MRLIAFMAAVAAIVSGVRAQVSDACVRCHREATPAVLVEHDTSVHAGLVDACTACHGGDARAETEAGGHAAAGFVGRGARAALVARCASCHAEAKLMRQPQLDTGVVAAWQKSRHGELAAQGDARGPDCVSCHGSHAIMTGADPRSPSHRSRLAESCGSCHAHADRMAPSEMRTDQVADYLAGAHGLLLLGKRAGDPRLAPACADCHDPHSAKPPNARQVPQVCADCHFEERRFLEQSAHGSALAYTGEPSCVSCHDRHRTVAPANLEQVCARCHAEAGDPGRRAAVVLQDLLRRADGELSRLADAVRTADGTPIVARMIEHERRRAEQLHAEVGRVAHTLDVAEVTGVLQRLADSVDTAAAVANVELAGHNGFSRQTVVLILGGLGVALLALSAVVVRLLVHAARRRRTEAEMQS